jgi:drug/metabolite transporter (DMT)-like permease
MLDLRLLAVALIWGVNFSVIKYAIGDFSPLAFTAIRFALASVFLFSLMAVRRERFAVERTDLPALMTLGLLGITLYNILFMEGLKLTTASHSALFISMSPLFAASLQVIAGREKLTPSLAGGMALASAGAFLIIRSSHGAITFASRTAAGDLMTIGASALWALYTMKARPLLTRYTPLAVTAYSVASGALLLLPFCAGQLRDQSWRAVSLGSWTALAFAALIGGGVAYVLWYEGVRRIGVTRTIAYHYLVPLVAVIVAALFLGERITALTMLGGLAILAGVALVQSKRSSS